LKEYAPELIPLLQDASPDVRLQALYSLGLLKVDIDKKELLPLLEDSSPYVAITAAWLATVKEWQEGPAYFRKWLQHPHADFSRTASAALSVTGRAGVPLMLEVLKTHPDSYVRANLAIGLIGEQTEVLFACDSLDSIFFTEQTKLWMWDERTPFRSLSPSLVTHIDQVPNYPFVVDQLTRLEILSMLSVMQYPKAQDAVKGFLKNKSWGVSGAAAGALLEEGDEEALNLVRGLLQEKDQAIRVQAALLLALLGKDPVAVKMLQEVYAEVDREMKIHILEALGRVGDPESIPFLVDILKEPFQLLRVVAASALIQSLYH
jgi:HEAT repeat protein